MRNLRHTPLALTLALLVLAPPTHAQEDAPLIEDPAGDAGPHDTAAPVAWDLFDLVSVRFAAEAEPTVEIHIETAAPGTQPAAGEIGVHYEADGAWWLMGWSTVAFPAPPFVYQGGFYCPSDADQGFDTSSCSVLPARFDDHALVLTLDREAFGLHRAGTTVTSPTAYSAIYEANGDPLSLDETAVGGTYTFQTGSTDPTSPAPEGGGEAPEVTMATPTTTPQPAASTAPPERANAEAPTAPIGLALVTGLVALAFARFTRRP